MRKILGTIIVIFSILSMQVKAEENTNISFKVDRQPIKGQEITIDVNVENVSRLYGLAVDYNYNPEEIQVTSIEVASLIKDSGLDVFEAVNDTERDGNRANYQMVFTGSVDGVSGNGSLVTIKAKVLKDINLNINEKNMQIQLIGINEEHNATSELSFKLNEVNLNETKENNDSKEEVKKEQENIKDDKEKSEESTSEKDVTNLKEEKSIFNKILKFFGVNNTNTQVQEEKNDNIKEENSKKDTSDESKKESKDNTEDKNVDTKKQDKDKENNKNTSSMLPAWGGGAVIVLVATIVIFKLKNKKGNKGEF
ncbi:MAG: cohesin domain-containing protein [Clostridium septicum]|uniref:cohesin domain-containing protein n=1 Tax=Clostridium septicum TaxID=1504 RepID=UPI0025836FA3|nr:cohesin domain-containing protein [Clostridium septicum]MDU1314094.1 cohesin domain-containing protein [Clostridium septicum]